MLLKVNVESEVENAVRELAITDKINRVLNKINTVLFFGDLYNILAFEVVNSPLHTMFILFKFYAFKGKC